MSRLPDAQARDHSGHSILIPQQWPGSPKFTAFVGYVATDGSCLIVHEYVQSEPR